MDKEQIIKDIENLRESKMQCAPATLIGISKNMDCGMSEPELLMLSSGFAAGIGGNLEEGTCGGITGSVLALGLTGKDAGKVQELSKILFDDFKKEFGTVECNKLTKNGEDKTHCTGYCVFAAKTLVDLLE